MIEGTLELLELWRPCQRTPVFDLHPLINIILLIPAWWSRPTRSSEEIRLIAELPVEQVLSERFAGIRYGVDQRLPGSRRVAAEIKTVHESRSGKGMVSFEEDRSKRKRGRVVRRDGRIYDSDCSASCERGVEDRWEPGVSRSGLGLQITAGAYRSLVCCLPHGYEALCPVALRDCSAGCWRRHWGWSCSRRNREMRRTRWSTRRRRREGRRHLQAPCLTPW